MFLPVLPLLPLRRGQALSAQVGDSVLLVLSRDFTVFSSLVFTPFTRFSCFLKLYSPSLTSLCSEQLKPRS